MKILDLSLTHHWYDEILSGRKKEEYREMKPFYQKRLMDGFKKGGITCANKACSICRWNKGQYPLCRPIKYDAIRFHRGQGSPTTMLVEFLNLRTGYGKTEWGAPDNEQVFIISLGRILSGTSGGQTSLCKE